MRVKIAVSCLAVAFCLVAAPVQADSVTDNLIAYWPFDGDFLDHAPSGTVFDDATLVTGNGGAALTTSDSRVGTGSFELSGIADGGYAEVPFAGDDIGVNPSTRDFTVATWAKIRSFAGTTVFQSAILQHDGAAASRTWLGIEDPAQDPDNPTAGPVVGFSALGAGGFDPFVLTGGPFNFNEWHHIAVVNDQVNGIQDFYFDGVLTATRTQTVEPSSVTGTLKIGRHKDGVPDREFDGFIDDLRIYDNWKSAADIVAIMNVGGPPPGLTGDFDSDGDVDGADFLLWQTGSATAGDLADWEANFARLPLSRPPRPYQSHRRCCYCALARWSLPRCGDALAKPF